MTAPLPPEPAPPSAEGDSALSPVNSPARRVAVTEEFEDFSAGRFAAVWPGVSARIRTYLLRFGTDVRAAEDAVQEAGTRALETQIGFEDPGDLERWARVVARNWLSNQRRAASRELLGEPPERPAASDTEHAVLARRTLTAVGRALHHLRPSDRQLVFSTFAGSADPLDQDAANRLKVARHRARLRLLALVETFEAVFLWIVVRIRGDRKVAVGSAATAAAVVAVTALAVVPHLASSPPRSAHKAADPIGVVTSSSRDANPQSFARTVSAATATSSKEGRSFADPGGTTYLQVQEPAPGGPLTVKHFQSPSDRPLSCTTTPSFGTICVGPALPSPPVITQLPPFLQP